MTDVSQSGAPRERELITEPLSNAIDPDHFTPRLLALLSNALVWRESHELRRRFGLGTNDWRVISSLGLRPGMSPISLRGQEIVLSHLAPEQITQLHDLLLAMLRKTRALMTLESEAGVASAAQSEPA